LAQAGVFCTKGELRFQRIFQIFREFGAEHELVRGDAVEHEAAHAVRVAHQILLGHARAVGNADEVELRRAERLAHRLQVVRGDRRRVVARIGFSLHQRQAFARRPAHFVEVRARLRRRIARLVLVFALAGQRVRTTGAALVQQQDVVMLAQRRERGRDPRPGLDRGLTGSAGQQHDKIRVGRFGVGLDQRNLQIDLAPLGGIRVLRHPERRAVRSRRCPGPLLVQFARLELQLTERELFRAGRYRLEQRPRRHRLFSARAQLAVSDVRKECERQNDAEDIAFRHRVTPCTIARAQLLVSAMRCISRGGCAEPASRLPSAA
jgi:hypothetical protein